MTESTRITWRKGSYCIDDAVRTDFPLGGKDEIGSLRHTTHTHTYTHTHTNSWVKELHVKGKLIKFLESKTGKNILMTSWWKIIS